MLYPCYEISSRLLMKEWTYYILYILNITLYESNIVNRFNCTFLITHFCPRGTFLICSLFHLNEKEWRIFLDFFLCLILELQKLQYSRTDSLRLKATIFNVFLHRLVSNKDDGKEADSGKLYECTCLSMSVMKRHLVDF
jgi:hypothetical protein